LPPPALHSFPTRRSSDLEPFVLQPSAVFRAALIAPTAAQGGRLRIAGDDHSAFPGRYLLIRIEGKCGGVAEGPHLPAMIAGADQDRKSTRLNSSHVSISY